jgi:hypothetical protein
MKQRVAVRVALSLVVCALVGLGLAASADETRWERHGVTVVTTSTGTFEGRLSRASAQGLEVVVGEKTVVVPWRSVARLSFSQGRP